MQMYGLMELEKEINQTKNFKSEFEKVIVNIHFTGNWINSIEMRFLKKFGLTPQQYNVLRILRGQHPKTAPLHLIQSRMLDKMSNASRLVDKLKAKDLVERQECPADRRQVDIWITERGLELLEELDVKMIEVETNIKNISEEEAVLLNKLLDKMRG